MPALRKKKREVLIDTILANIEASKTYKHWDDEHLSKLLSWSVSCKYDKLRRTLRNPENAKLGDVLDILDKLGIEIEIKERSG